MLPIVLLLFSVALTARRLVHPLAYLLAFLAFFFAGSASGMFMPTEDRPPRLAARLAGAGGPGMTDPDKARGGAVLGLASALSLAIGLELMIYLAVMGGAVVLFWVARARAGADARLRSRARSGHRDRLPAVRLLRQSRAGVRRSVAGVAVGRAGRRGLAVRAQPAGRRRVARRLVLAAAAGASWPPSTP